MKLVLIRAIIIYILLLSKIDVNNEIIKYFNFYYFLIIKKIYSY